MKQSLLSLAALVVLLMPVTLHADQPEAVDLTNSFRAAGLSDIDRLQVYEVGGIVILRGRTDSNLKAEDAGRIATSLGYTRVANLIQLTSAPDDGVILRAAERALARHRSLDGCKLRVDSQHGVVRIAGTVHSELQKQVAIELVKNVDGVRSVQSDLTH